MSLHRYDKGPDGESFPWGPITGVHSIGPYDIVEATWNGGVDKGKTAFFVYVDKKSICRSAEALDGALMLAVAAHNGDGPNGEAARYFMKMLGAKL